MSAENTSREVRPINRLEVDGGEDRVVVVNGELAEKRDAGLEHVKLEAEDLNGDRVFINVGIDNDLSVGAHWPEKPGGVQLQEDDSVDDGRAFSDPAVQLVGDVQIIKEGEA